MRRAQAAGSAALLVFLLGSKIRPGDPLAGDPIDPETGYAAEILPGVPWISLETVPPTVYPGVVGDIDLVVRAGASIDGDGFPLPAPLRGVLPEAVASVHQAGRIDVWLALSDGDPSLPAGRPVAPDYMPGLPFLIMAFPDLDGDGYVGITHLDGDPADARLEREELFPVGRRYAIPRKGRATEKLSISVGGPLGMPVAVTAVGIAGAFENPNLPCAGCHSWPGDPAAEVLLLPVPQDAELAPEGSVVATHLPFFPDTDFELIEGARGNVPAHPDARVAVQAEIGFWPDPSHPLIGERFTLRLDGSQASIDVARSFSGSVARFGVVRDVDPATWSPRRGGLLRPGLNGLGEPAPVEVIDSLPLTGAANLRVVGLDALGNVAFPVASAGVTIRALGDAAILSPDADGDASVETLEVSAGPGVPLRVSSETWTGGLLIEGGGGLSYVRFGPPPTGAPAPQGQTVLAPESDGDVTVRPWEAGGGGRNDDDD